MPGEVCAESRMTTHRDADPRTKAPLCKEVFCHFDTPSTSATSKRHDPKDILQISLPSIPVWSINRRLSNAPPPPSAYAKALTSVRRRGNQGHGKVKQPQHWMWVNNISCCYVKIWTAAATLNTVCLCPADSSSERLQRKPSSHVPRATRECHAEQ